MVNLVYLYTIMTKLIQRFEQQHHEIDRVLKEVKLLGPTTKEGHERLLEAKELITKHLQEENEVGFMPCLFLMDFVASINTQTN